MQLTVIPRSKQEVLAEILMFFQSFIVDDTESALLSAVLVTH